jgi:hypothetical protein
MLGILHEDVSTFILLTATQNLRIMDRLELKCVRLTGQPRKCKEQ